MSDARHTQGILGDQAQEGEDEPEEVGSGAKEHLLVPTAKVIPCGDAWDSRRERWTGNGRSGWIG